jgi:FixJ family two-component response regulator
MLDQGPVSATKLFFYRAHEMATKARRIAVVDDDPGVLRAMRRLLRSANFEVEAYSSGTEFLKAERDAELDCVVLDLHMPQTTGFDVQARLSERGATVPVIIITGDDTPETRARSLSLGAKRYLCKPIDEATLLAAIDSVTGTLRGTEPQGR